MIVLALHQKVIWDRDNLKEWFDWASTTLQANKSWEKFESDNEQMLADVKASVAQGENSSVSFHFGCEAYAFVVDCGWQVGTN